MNVPGWLKSVLAIVGGFATTAGGVVSQGGNTKTALITGGLGALATLAGLHTTAPADQKRLQ